MSQILVYEKYDFVQAHRNEKKKKYGQRGASSLWAERGFMGREGVYGQRGASSLNRANALLFKMRKYVSLKILRSIYFAIFDSYLSYCCLVWAQNSSTIQQIVILQKKSC